MPKTNTAAKTATMTVRRFINICPNTKTRQASKSFELFFLPAFDFELDRGVLDIELYLQGIFDAVQNLMKIPAVGHYRVGAQCKNIGGNCPNVQVVDGADAIHRFDRSAHVFETDTFRH